MPWRWLILISRTGAWVYGLLTIGLVLNHYSTFWTVWCAALAIGFTILALYLPKRKVR